MNRPILIDDRVARGRQGLPKRGGLIERIPMLFECHDAKTVCPCDRAAVRLHRAGEYAQERCFPASIRSQETEPLAGTKLYVQIGDHRPAGEGLAELPGYQQLFGSAAARHKIDRDGALYFTGFCPIEFRNQLFGGLDATLGFRRTGFGAASEPFHFTTHAIGQRSLIAGLSLQHGIALLEKIAIASRRLEQSVGVAAIQFQHARGDSLQKPSIMAYDQERFGLRFEQGFEPENAVDIKVIGRFVHQQHIRFEHDGTGDREPFTPSSREGRDRLIGLWKGADAEGLGNLTGVFVRVAVVFRQDL